MMMLNLTVVTLPLTGSGKNKGGNLVGEQSLRDGYHLVRRQPRGAVVPRE